MAMVRNASNQPLNFIIDGVEFRLSPEDEIEMTDLQLASEAVINSEEFLVVSPSTSNIPEADPVLLQAIAIEEQMVIKTDSKKNKN